VSKVFDAGIAVMPDLFSATVQQQIESLYEAGDALLNIDQFSAALAKYRQAAGLIPEPVTQQPTALPVYTAIGEAYYYAGQFQEALGAFQMAMKAPGGIENPLTHLRLAQAYFEIGDLDLAADELTRGYMLGGRELFVGEDEKYLKFLATRIVL
jgi:tetratricopeptide (TPR) repeat protein